MLCNSRVMYALVVFEMMVLNMKAAFLAYRKLRAGKAAFIFKTIISKHDGTSASVNDLCMLL